MKTVPARDYVAILVALLTFAPLDRQAPSLCCLNAAGADQARQSH